MLRITANGSMSEFEADFSDESTRWCADEIAIVQARGEGGLEMLYRVIGKTAVDTLVENGLTEEQLADLYASIAAQVCIRRYSAVNAVMKDYSDES